MARGNGERTYFVGAVQKNSESTSLRTRETEQKGVDLGPYVTQTDKDTHSDTSRLSERQGSYESNKKVRFMETIANEDVTKQTTNSDVDRGKTNSKDSNKVSNGLGVNSRSVSRDTNASRTSGGYKFHAGDDTPDSSRIIMPRTSGSKASVHTPGSMRSDDFRYHANGSDDGKNETIKEDHRTQKSS